MLEVLIASLRMPSSVLPSHGHGNKASERSHRIED